MAVSLIVVHYSERPLFQKINRRLRLDVLLTITLNLPYSLNPQPGSFAPRTLCQSSFCLFAGREVFRSSLMDLRISEPVPFLHLHFSTNSFVLYVCMLYAELCMSNFVWTYKVQNMSLEFQSQNAQSGVSDQPMRAWKNGCKNDDE